MNYLKKKCILQWVPAHCGLEYNEIADSLANSGRCQDQTGTPTSLADANALIKLILKTPSAFKIKYQIPQLDVSRKTATTITRLQMKHYKNMKISPDGTKTYQGCSNCPDIELTPDHVFDCPAVTAVMHSLNYPGHEDLYSDLAANIAEIIQKHHVI